MARRRPKSRDTKDRLMASAVEVIGTKGYQSTCIDDIVEHSGNTRGAFYYYFAGKADVARDAEEKLWSNAGRRTPEVDSEPDFLTRARRGLEVYVAALKDLGPERHFLREGFDQPSLAMIDDEGRKWGTHFVRAFLSDAMEKGDIPQQDFEEKIPPLVDALEALTHATLNGDDVTETLALIDALNRGLVHPDPARLHLETAL